MNLSDKKIVVVTHIYALGPPIVDLEQYLQKRVKKLTIIGFPFSYSKIERSFYRQYSNGQQIREYEKKAALRKDSYLFLRDFFWALVWGWKSGRTDLFIGINNLNALAGLILRMFGRTKAVVYYTIDYNPTRFSNLVMNRIYHAIDTYCVKHADYVWNLSSVMTTERAKKGVPHRFQAKQLTVPIGVNATAQPKEPAKMHQYEIAYMGHLRPGQGVEFLIDSFPEIVKNVPNAKLAILGGGGMLDKLKARAKELDIAEKVFFSGFVKDPADLEERLSYAQVAVAPYEDTPGNFTRYTDPGKPKSYLSLGLPIVITKVPQFAHEIDKHKAGVAIDFDQKQLVEAVTGLLKDQKKWMMYHKNALNLAQEYLWDKVFDKAFAQMKSIK